MLGRDGVVAMFWCGNKLTGGILRVVQSFDNDVLGYVRGTLVGVCVKEDVMVIMVLCS